MSQTAQLLNVLAGLASGTGAPHAAPAGQAKPAANAPDGFLALLLLTGADTDASASLPGALPSTNAQPVEAQAKGLLNAATVKPDHEAAPSAQAREPAQADKPGAELPLLLPATATKEGLVGLLTPGAASVERAQDTEMPEARPAHATGTSQAALAATAEPPKIASVALLSDLPQASAASIGTPSDGAAAAVQAHAAKTAATEQAANTQADAAAKAEAEALAATSQAAKPAVAPTREAIINASLTSVASTLLGDKSSSAGTGNNSTGKPATKPAGTTFAPAPKDPVARNSAPPPATQPTTQAAAPPPSQDMSARSDTASIARAANFAPPQEQAPKAEGAAPALANHYTPGQATHAAVPVIVVRAAPAAHEAMLAQERIALAVVRQFHAGISRFQIRLDPPELGRIDVKMSVQSDGHVSAQLTADRPETLALLQRDARVLQRALGEAGLQMDSGSLSFGLRDPGGRQVFDQGTPSAPYPSADPEEDEDVAALAYGVALVASLEPGRIDLRI